MDHEALEQVRGTSEDGPCPYCSKLSGQLIHVVHDMYHSVAHEKLTCVRSISRFLWRSLFGPLWLEEIIC